jgi:hypothetical protein
MSRFSENIYTGYYATDNSAMKDILPPKLRILSGWEKYQKSCRIKYIICLDYPQGD